METTFITIHDLSPECHILYSSDSVVDVLGYAPEEVVNRSCWNYFHPDELPLARLQHGKGIKMDKAAMLSYCRMKNRDGNWVGCEVVFTVVYDCLVGCTSIYRRGLKSQNRANEAPVVRRLFHNAPRDPRYHMLSHLSAKFSTPSPTLQPHEPRAALFLNRFTRTLTIMYATNGLIDTLGIGGEELIGQSFYYCIQESCLSDAVRCLENAKANDSIAYLRFWWRRPWQNTNRREQWSNAQMEVDSRGSEGLRSSDEDTEMSGVETTSHSRYARPHVSAPKSNSVSSSDEQAVSSSSSVEPVDSAARMLAPPEDPDSRASSGDSNPHSHQAVFGESRHTSSSHTSMSSSPDHVRSPVYCPEDDSGVELEAVVSCTSDGLVVCLRRAQLATAADPIGLQRKQTFTNGLFAVPWSPDPIVPPATSRPNVVQQTSATLQATAQASVMSQTPSGNDFMQSIRECAVFAWGLVGINGSLADFSKGKPHGEAQPASGLPIWQPEDALKSAEPSQAQGGARHALDPGGKPILDGDMTPTGPLMSSSGNLPDFPGAKDNTGQPQNFSRPLQSANHHFDRTVAPQQPDGFPDSATGRFSGGNGTQAHI